MFAEFRGGGRRFGPPLNTRLELVAQNTSHYGDKVNIETEKYYGI